MTVEQRIAAIKAALVAIETSLAQTAAALRLAATLDDVARLNEQLVTLKARRTQLQFELINLEASLVVVGPAAAARAAAGPTVKLTAAQNKAARKLSRELKGFAADRRVIEAAFAQATDVLDRVSALQAILSGAGGGDE